VLFETASFIQEKSSNYVTKVVLQKLTSLSILSTWHLRGSSARIWRCEAKPNSGKEWNPRIGTNLSEW